MSEMRFHWSISVWPVDPEFVPDDAALARALEMFAGTSVCTDLVPPPRPMAQRHARPRFHGSEGFSYTASCPVCGQQVERETAVKGSAGRRWFAMTDELAAQGVDGAMSHWIQASGQPPQEPDLAVLREVASRFPKNREGILAAKLLA